MRLTFPSNGSFLKSGLSPNEQTGSECSCTQAQCLHVAAWDSARQVWDIFDTYITESGEKAPWAVALQAKTFPYQWTFISQVIFGSCSEKILKLESLSMLRPLTLHHLLRASCLALHSLKWKVPLLGINVQKRQGGGKRVYTGRRQGGVLDFYKLQASRAKSWEKYPW